MKTLRTRTGPFNERPFFEAQDIENICSDELRATKLYPSKPEPIRIDRFIEKRFGITHRYDELPEGILGLTRFGQNGVEDIVVARALDNDKSEAAGRRVSTTLAHEAGHGLLHTYLFVLGKKPRNLFDESESDDPLILCRHDELDPSKPNRYRGRWWEFQANQAMTSLLLPLQLVDTALTPLLTGTGNLEMKSLDQKRRGDAVKQLAKIFEVNPIVARLRLDALCPDTAQLHL